MREAGRSRFEGGERILLKRCKRKKAAREGEKRERKMNEGTKRREDVDVVIATEKRVGTENRREDQRKNKGEGKGRGRNSDDV